MDSYYYLPEHLHAGTKAMIFVDGENLAIRFKDALGSEQPQDHVVYEPDVLVWSKFANVPQHTNCEVTRRYYYSSSTGDAAKIEELSRMLKRTGIEQPRIFHKSKGRRSKRVDISLATDMLTHAHRKNYDIAILVSGDEDYVPLVEAVAAEGCRVVLWALPNGLSPRLEQAVDHSFDISRFLLRTAQELNR